MTFCASLTSAALPLGPSGYESWSAGRDSRCARWCSWAWPVLVWFGYGFVPQVCFKTGMTYKRKTTVCAPADLGLIGVDEDPGVTERAASTVAGNDALVRPANGLLVDEVDSGVWARLRM